MPGLTQGDFSAVGHWPAAVGAARTEALVVAGFMVGLALVRVEARRADGLAAGGAAEAGLVPGLVQRGDR